MTEKELHEIIEQGEGYFTEFKRNINTDIKKEMVSFANASGGKIFVGVEDNGFVSGVDITNELLSKVHSAAHDCDPPISITIEKIGTNVLLINVKEGQAKPYRSTNGFYLRNGANAQKMKTNDIIEFIEKEGRIRFDEQIRYDIDYQKYFSKIKWGNFARLAKIDSTQKPNFILKSLGAIKKVKGVNYFTNAGILLFADTPGFFLPQSSIACVLYKGKEKVNIIDRKDFDSDIISNIDDTIKFLKRHINISSKIESLYRQDILEIPEVALREAVVNAVIHRDYLEKGAKVLVEIFDDRISVSNPGGLPKGLEQKDFGKYSVTRNSVIASILLRTDLIEQLGTGISRMNNALTEAGLTKANFNFSTFFSVIFYKNLFTEKTTSKTTSKTAGKTTSKKDLIINIIKDNKFITAKEIAIELDLSEEGVRYHLKKLKKSNLIIYIGSAKDGYWKIINE